MSDPAGNSGSPREEGVDLPRLLGNLSFNDRRNHTDNNIPLPSDTNWNKIPHAGLKKECNFRNIPTDGKAPKTLRKALKNYKVPERLPPVEDMGDIVGKNKSANGEKRKAKWLDTPDETFREKLEIIQKDTFCLISMNNNDTEQTFGSPSIEFRMASDKVNGSQHRVIISKLPDCDSVLVNILRVPEPLRWQNAFLQEELETFFQPILRASSTGTVSDCNVGRLANGKCPGCFKLIEFDWKLNPITCSDCHVKVHHTCFHVWVMHQEDAGKVKCISCSNDWTQPGRWGAGRVLTSSKTIERSRREGRTRRESSNLL
ncbi:hypothetical protein KJ359_005983 [Pestalotiopsis sp. 9143b]|nr:hypothetical protein KJ359_005983 [Pestalotiopsis sp. 9143b]